MWVSRYGSAVWLLIGLGGCSLGVRRSSFEAELAGLLAPLVQSAGEAARGEPIDWLGVRDGAGKRSEIAALLEEYLISALMLEGVPLQVADSLSAGEWEGDEVVPERLWRACKASRALAGRLEQEGAWNYLRLFAIDREEGRLLAVAHCRLPRDRLETLTTQQHRQEQQPAVEEPLAMEIHYLGLRNEGGIAHPVPLGEGGILQVGDRLQVRFRVRSDCQVYAFLYTSEGTREEIFGNRYVYAGRWQYGPGPETWIELRQAGLVQTLYIIAARRLAEDWEGLWEQMGELIEQRQVDRFIGLELLDRALVEFLLRGVEREAAISVSRGREGVRMGRKERFILEDGTSLESQAEELRGSQVLVRAITFAVQ